MSHLESLPPACKAILAAKAELGPSVCRRRRPLAPGGASSRHLPLTPIPPSLLSHPGLSFEDLASSIGRDEVYTAAIAYGQVRSPTSISRNPVRAARNAADDENLAG